MPPVRSRQSTQNKTLKPLAFVQVVGGILINNSGKVLVAKRASHKSNGGFWEFPGGKVEPGEQNEEALARELKEELGIEVEVKNLLCSNSHTSEHGRIELHCYFCIIQAGTPQALEHSEVEYCTALELRELVFTPANWAALDLILQKLVP